MNGVRRALLRAAGIAVLLAVGAGPAGAAKPAAKCQRPGSTTVAKSSVARVYEVQDDEPIPTTELYGCLYARGTPKKIGEAFDDDFVISYGYRTVRLAGRFVAFAAWDEDISCKADCPPSYDPRDDWVTVWDLSARKARTEDGIAAGSTLKLNGRGASAWLERLGGGQRDVHAWDADGHRVLDTGSIKAASFTLKGSTLRWVDVDVARSATLR